MMIGNLTRQRLIRFFKREDWLLRSLPIMGRIIWYYASIIAMAPVMIILFLLRPFVVIRAGELRTDAIGHLALNQELYLCERDRGLHPGRTYDIFFYSTYPFVNYQLARMWRDKLRICRFAYYIWIASNFYPGFKRHLIDISSRDRHGLMNDSRPHLAFTESEIKSGEEALLNMGIGDGKYVCLIVRDRAYKESITPDKDWSYHDYINMDVNTCMPAMENLADRGYSVLRMGAVVSKRIESSNPRIIDYAANGMRTDFLDIYLSANCHFFMVNTTGLEGVPRIFRRPVLSINNIPLEYVRAESANDLIIFKKLWLREEKRFMTFREIMESGVGRFVKTEQYEKYNLEVIDNTPEEIEAAAIEMDERLKGIWQTTDEDEELQRRFWSLFKPGKLNGVFLSRVGTEFLRQHRDWL
jgi:putative glycosyltransferase (TIGR04372 family)